jgi:hypothetical protein
MVRRSYGRMMIGSHFRPDFLASGIRVATPVLFGTTGLSGLSAFGTAVRGFEPASAR